MNLGGAAVSVTSGMSFTCAFMVQGVSTVQGRGGGSGVGQRRGVAQGRVFRMWGSRGHGLMDQCAGFMVTLTDEQPREQVPGAIGSRAGAEECPEQEGGALKCWGRGDDGQFGDGTYNTRYTPVVP